MDRLLGRIEQEKPVRTPGDAIFLSANAEGAPAALLANLRYNHVLHERVLLLTVQFEEVPYIDRDARIEVVDLRGTTRETQIFRWTGTELAPQQ